MTRLARAATSLPVVCLLISALSTRGAMSADLGGHSRYVMAPADPTSAPADPTLAPGDPTLAPADPRDAFEPRDMTTARAVRRALRGRSRDRIAPDQPTPSTQPLRDLTDLPVAAGRTGFGHRFETLFRTLPADKPPTIPRRETPRLAPPEPQSIATHTPPTLRTAPPAPPATAALAAPVHPPIQLAQGNPEPPLPALNPQPSPADHLAFDEQRVLSLNKPITRIALIEPVDIEGLRPADVSAELQPPTPPVLLTGSLFVEAHPARYLYCFTHQPLYFEEANLERCGLASCCCQPIVSAAQFVGRTALLPYSLLDVPHCRCVRTLGDCPTCHAYPCGLDWNR